MAENKLQIDKSTHKRVPTIKERIKNALLALFLGFIIVNIIGFWMFPGPGIFGIYMFSSAHSSVEFIGNLTNVGVITFLILCLVFGWFNGKYFTDRLKGYIEYWKFW
jgi:hypothetical protein